MSSSIMVCGGRENLLSLSSSCWLYTKDKDTWEEAWTLPRAVAGAATICMENRMILLGGVMEEDYYQGEDIEGGDYYDYSTEVSSSLAFEFDMRTKSWKEGHSLPEALQGGCGLAWEGRMVVTGGKNDENCSYGTDSAYVG
jgi:N-acetylneuraminic acid mutarotase